MRVLSLGLIFLLSATVQVVLAEDDLFLDLREAIGKVKEHGAKEDSRLERNLQSRLADIPWDLLKDVDLPVGGENAIFLWKFNENAPFSKILVVYKGEERRIESEESVYLVSLRSVEFSAVKDAATASVQSAPVFSTEFSTSPQVVVLAIQIEGSWRVGVFTEPGSRMRELLLSRSDPLWDDISKSASLFNYVEFVNLLDSQVPVGNLIGLRLGRGHGMVLNSTEVNILGYTHERFGGRGDIYLSLLDALGEEIDGFPEYDGWAREVQDPLKGFPGMSGGNN